MVPQFPTRTKYRPCGFSADPFPKVVDDLLEMMLEGWVFGERQAEHSASGFIPAVKESGPLRPGDQRRAVAYLEHR